MIKNNLFSVSCGILILSSVCLARPAQAALDVDDIPMAARMVLVKTTELMKQKSYERAIAVLTAFQAKGKAIPVAGQPDPKGYHHPVLYYYIGNCYLLQKMHSQAEEAYRHAVEGDPDFIEAWTNLAKTYFEQEDFLRAAPCFATAYEKSDQRIADNLYFSAVSYLMADQYGASISAFQRLVEKHPDRLTLQWRAHFAQALLSDGQACRALPLIRILAEESTGAEQIKWQEILLYQYLQLEMRAEALACATELTRRECTRAIWWKALAHVELSGGCYKKALVALTIYSYLTPLTETEKKLWADLNLQLNIPARAIEQYRSLLSQQFDRDSLKNLVSAYQRLERYQEALDHLNRFAPDTDDSELLMLKADMLYALKQYSEAGALFRRVAQNQTSQAGQAWLMAGYAAWQSNDFTAGRKAFKKAAGHRRFYKAAHLAMRQMAETYHPGMN
jgi:tetratricopeptide (TPR) repeat protein